VNPQAPDTGEEITLNAADSTGDIESYEWQLPDSTASGQTTTTTFETAGEYEVQLTVTDTDGETASTAQTVTVAAPVAASFTVTPAAPATGEEVTLDGSESVGGIESYEWSFDGRTASGQTATATFGEAGEYEVRLTVTDAAGDTAEATQTVSVAQSLDGTFSVLSDRVRTGEEVTLDAGGLVENPAEFRWDFTGDGTTDTTTPNARVTHTFESPGPRTVTLDIETSDGAVNRTSSEVSVVLSSFDEATAPLVENAMQLNSIVESPSSVGRADGTVAALRRRLDTARTQIDGIDSEDVSERVETARTIADFQEQLINDLETSTTFAEQFRDGFEAFGTIRENVLETESQPLADAVSALESAVGTLDTIRSDRSDVQAAKDAVSGDLGRDALDYSDSLNEYVAYNQSQLDGLEQLTNALVDPLAAMRDLFGGREAFETERWQDALDQFTNADEARTRATNTPQLSDAVVSSAPNPSAGQILQGAATLMGTLSQAFSLHIDAATAATNGNIQQAQSTFDDATAQLEANIEPPEDEGE
jgi:PKD repeat protein